MYMATCMMCEKLGVWSLESIPAASRRGGAWMAFVFIQPLSLLAWEATI